MCAKPEDYEKRRRGDDQTLSFKHRVVHKDKNPASRTQIAMMERDHCEDLQKDAISNSMKIKKGTFGRSVLNRPAKTGEVKNYNVAERTKMFRL